MNFELNLAEMSLQTSITVSLLSACVLVGLFQYLNRYTKRRYFAIWTSAWLFYALFLTLSLFASSDSSALLGMAKNWSIVTAAILMLWGSFSFMGLATSERLIGITLVFVTVWSYSASFLFPNQLWVSFPTFLLLAFASAFNAVCFFFLRHRKPYLGAGLLTFGFALWAMFLLSYPFLQAPETLLSMAFLIAGVLQLFMGISMIILVLEEVRADMRRLEGSYLQEREQVEYFRSKAEVNEREYQRLFESASDAILIADEKTLEIRKMNEAAKDLFRVSDFPEGFSLRDFCAVLGAKAENLSSSEWLQQLCVSLESELTRQDGSKVRVQVRGGLIPEARERTWQLLMIELTQRHQLEKQLRQAEKLAALGQMISGIAHELNNPLATIKGFTELLLRGGNLNEQTRNALTKVSQESNRAAKLVQNFLSFARPDAPQALEVNLNNVISEIAEVRTGQLRSNGITLFVELSDANPVILGSPEQLHEVVQNLLTNAEQAMSASNSQVKEIFLSTSITDDRACIRVEDSGPGIPEAVALRIFEPFFTTKPPGMGTGLGLSICYSIALRHKGRLYYQHGAAPGACFVLDLPLLKRPTQQPPGLASPSERPQLAEQLTILVIDDEPSLRELMKEMLILLGHKVHSAETAETALTIIKSVKLDLIVSDFRMPGMDGSELYTTAVALNASIASKFVFVTGDVVNTETRRFFEKTRARYILKPFDMATLEGAVASASAKVPLPVTA